MTANFMSTHLDPIALDDRVCQQFIGNLGGERLGLRGFRRCEIELEVLALTDVFNAVVSERMERFGNRAALWIEYRWLERDEYSGSHVIHLDAETTENTRSKIWSTYLNCSAKSNARSTSAAVSTREMSA